jgi:hypothetical protein
MIPCVVMCRQILVLFSVCSVFLFVIALLPGVLFTMPDQVLLLFQLQFGFPISTKMAESVGSYNSHSRISTENGVYLHQIVCNNCSEYEEHLKEVINEFSSAETII